MDSHALVVNQLDDGRTLVEELPRRGFDVAAGFWLKPSETGKWSFYIVSPLVESASPREAYRQLAQHVRAMPQPFWISPLEIRLLDPSNPLARDVLEVTGQYPGVRAPRLPWRGYWLGNISVDEAYIYAAPVSTPEPTH